MRLPITAALAAGVLLLGASPAAVPDHPVSFIKVDELRALTESPRKVDIIDVRTWGEYEVLHIKGARSMPLRSVRERAGEVSKTGLVVLY